MTYAWLRFIVTPFDEVSETLNLIGNVVFVLCAVILHIGTSVRVRRMNDTFGGESREP